MKLLFFNILKIYYLATNKNKILQKYFNFYHNYITKKKIVGELKKYQQKKKFKVKFK